MNVKEIVLKPNETLNSGGVTRYEPPQDGVAVTRITTFCPDEIGPGPTHLYLIESDSVVLVDAGLPTMLAKAFFYQWRGQSIPSDVADLPADHSMRELLEGLKLAGRSMSDIDLLIFTHGHPDHFLMAPSILNGADASVSAHVLDTPTMCNPWGMLQMWIAGQQRMKATGMPEAFSARNMAGDQALQAFNLEALGAMVKVDAPIFGEGPLSVKGKKVRDVEVIHIPGHSQGSLGLLVGAGDERILISGDVILNPITPHPEDLLTYLRTIDRLEKLGNIAITLPAHGHAIPDLKARAQFLTDHHRHRLELTYGACSEPSSVWDIATMKSYFDVYIDPAKFNYLAGQEALVHMELLAMAHGLKRVDIKDQTSYYQNSGEPFEDVYVRAMEIVSNPASTPNMRY